MKKFKKIKIILFLLCIVSYSFPYDTDSLGINNKPILNIHEYEYIRDLLKREGLLKDSLNVENKYAFITGSSGHALLFKEKFFKECIIPWIEKNHDPVVGIVYLTKDEKLKSGGYDAIIYAWVKVFSNYSKKRAIRHIEKMQNYD